MKRIFHVAVGREQRDTAIKETQEHFPSEFSNPYITDQYLFRVILPPTLKWAYKPIAKCGTSSLLRLLFEIEFGTKLSVRTTPLDDINPSHVFHMLASSRVFGRAIEYGFSVPDLLNGPNFGVRIALVRNPFTRLISGWQYLCLSHAKRSRWFEIERARLTAICGFDWDAHPGTEYGFRLFLDYLEEEINNVGVEYVNDHWRPQYNTLKPEAFRPTIVGKIESIDEFVPKLCEALECKPLIDLPHENKTVGENGVNRFYNCIQAIKQCERLYQRDFEYFSY